MCVCVGGWVGGRREIIIISVDMHHPVPMVTRHFGGQETLHNDSEHMEISEKKFSQKCL